MGCSPRRAVYRRAESRVVDGHPRRGSPERIARGGEPLRSPACDSKGEAPEERPGQKAFYAGRRRGLRLAERGTTWPCWHGDLRQAPTEPERGPHALPCLEVRLQEVKSIVKIDLVDRQPTSIWIPPRGQYGFTPTSTDVQQPAVAATERRSGGAPAPTLRSMAKREVAALSGGRTCARVLRPGWRGRKTEPPGGPPAPPATGRGRTPARVCGAKAALDDPLLCLKFLLCCGGTTTADRHPYRRSPTARDDRPGDPHPVLTAPPQTLPGLALDGALRRTSGCGASSTPPHLFTFAVIDYALDPGLTGGVGRKSYVLAAQSSPAAGADGADLHRGGWPPGAARTGAPLSRPCPCRAHYVWLARTTAGAPDLRRGRVRLLVLRTPP